MSRIVAISVIEEIVEPPRLRYAPRLTSTRGRPSLHTVEEKTEKAEWLTESFCD